MSKQNLSWLCKFVLATYILPLTIAQSATEPSWRIMYTKSNGDVVSFAPHELFEALTNPKMPSRREFETEDDFNRRLANWKNDLEKMKNGKFDVQIPYTSVKLYTYDMDRGGFPFRINACRWLYKTRTDRTDTSNPVVEYDISTIYVSTVGLFQGLGFVDIGGFLPIDTQQAKELRARQKEMYVFVRDLRVEIDTRSAYFGRGSSDRRKADEVSDLLRPWVYVDPWKERQFTKCRVREICLKAIEPESDAWGWNIKRHRKIHKLTFVLGERSWSTDEWRSLPDVD